MGDEEVDVESPSKKTSFLEVDAESPPKKTSFLAPSRPSLRNRLSASKAQSDPKQTRHLSLFGAGFSLPNKALGFIKPRASLFSQGNTLSPVPISQASKHKYGSDDGNKGDEDAKKRSRASMTIWGSPGFQDDGKPYSAKQSQKRRRSWLAHRQIKFESASGRPEPEDNLKVYLDDLAKKRTHESSKQERVQKEEAILHHRDSLLGASMMGGSRRQFVESNVPEPSPPPPARSNLASAQQHRQSTSRQSTTNPPAGAPVAVANGVVRALKKLGMFANCSEEFFGLLASQGEVFRLNSGEFREVAGARKGLSLRARLACAVVVVSGSCRVEVGRRIISECSPGSAYGLANVLAGISQGRTNSSGQQAVDHFTIRPSGGEGCHCLIVTATLLRQTLTHCHHDQAHLQEVLHILNQPVDSTRQLLSTLQCSETLKQTVIDGSTRHLFLRGEAICKEGEDRPLGLILIRCGIVSIEINGVEVRKVSGCTTIGEEMICNVSPTWAFSATCVTPCDVQILHRHLFLPLVRDMQSGDTEDRSASQRLLNIVDGNWKENKAILAWPLFRGYDVTLLTVLGHHLETRVVLPGRRIWEGGPSGFGASGRENALYFLLVGSCDETCYVERGPQDSTENIAVSDLRKVKRCLVQGGCVGSREFLGCRDKYASTVIAKTICLLVVLHRNVFLHVLDGLTNEQKKMQSAEVAQILQEQLDSDSSVSQQNRNFSELVQHVPLFNFSEAMCLQRICEMAVRLFCIPGQNLCHRGADMDALFVISRGSVVMKMADIDIKRHTSGDVLSLLSLCVNGFIPSYILVCGAISEVWSVHRQDVLRELESFPSEKARLNTLIKAQLREPTKEEEDEANFLVPVANMKLFQGCSVGLLQWISDHLEICVYFPKQVIVSEQEDHCGDTSFYTVCEGQVIGYSNSDRVQVSLVTGNYFGEMRLLGISERVDTSMQAMEITILQVLHQSVFKRGLELFPGDVEHFEKVMLAGIADQETLHLSSVPFFSGCSQDFCREVERLMVTKLVQKGGIIIERGSRAANDFLHIIRTGTAASDECDELQPSGMNIVRQVSAEALSNHQRTGAIKADGHCHFPESSIVNMDAVLGMQRQINRTIRALTPCAIVRISALPFLHVLQRFPSEVTRLVCRTEVEKAEAKGETQVQLWPRMPSAIPLLKDTSIGLFEILMSISEWHMYLPEQHILRQGQKGKIMYILCYGEAAIDADGICIEEAFPGHCFGHRNFLGVTSIYDESLRTVTVTHFRRLEADELDRHIHDVPGESDRLQQLRLLVRQGASDESKIRQQKIWNEKLRRRKVTAFRHHISKVRSHRGFPQPFQAAPTQAVAAKVDETQEDVKKENMAPDGSDSVARTVSSVHGSVPGSRRSSYNDGFSADWVSLDRKNKQIASVRNSICVTGGNDVGNDSRRSVRPSTFMTAHAFKVASFMQRMKEKKNRYPNRMESSDFDSDESSKDDSDSVNSSTDSQPHSEMWSGSRSNSVNTSRSVSICGSEAAWRKASRASIAGLGEPVAQERSSFVGITRNRRAGGVGGYLPGMMGPVTEERRVSILSPGLSPGITKDLVKKSGGPMVNDKDLPRERRRTPPGQKNAVQAKGDAGSEDSDLSDSSSASSTEETSPSNTAFRGGKRGTMKVQLNNDSDTAFEISVMAPRGLETIGDGDPVGGDLVEKIFFAKMRAFNDAKPLTRTERIEAAISAHTEGRCQKIERGKVLRALQNGRFPPPVSDDAEYDPRDLYLEQAHDKEFFRPGVKMPGKALHRKFKQLTRPTSSASLHPD